VRQRIRHSADEAKRLILEAAERRFREGGYDSVRVQLVARDVGMTDAAVHHHFGSRKGLLTALLRRAGRGVREEVEAAVGSWSEGSRDLASLARLFADCYDRRGYARLAMWLTLSGVRGRGQGMLSALVDGLRRSCEIAAHEQGLVAPTQTQIQFVVALFHMVEVAEPLFGEGMRRSAGLPDDEASRDRFRTWLLGVFAQLLQAKDASGIEVGATSARRSRCLSTRNHRGSRSRTAPPRGSPG
jgi:TetR/AcrR family transcriptional regulator, repressor for neighboring sulfatase